MPSNKFAMIRYRVIDELLTNKYKKYPGIQDIIEKCSDILGIKVSKSTIEKDIFAMRNDEGLNYFAPIEYDARFRGYFYTDPDFSIRSLPLKTEEIEAIRFASDILMQLANTPLFRHYAEVINTLALSDLHEKEQSWPIIQFEHNPTATGTQWLGTLYEAIRTRKKVILTYHSFEHSGAAEVEVSPFLLKSYRLRWYLIGKNEVRNQVRIYGLDRVENLTVSEKTFQHPAGFNPDDYFKYSFGISVLDNPSPEKVVLQISKELAPYLKSQPLHHSQVIKQDDDSGLTLELTVWLTRELMMALLGYGPDVKILEPESLRKEIADLHGKAGGNG